MSSLEHLADPTYRVKKGPDCTVALILATADDETRALFLAAMANPHAPSTKIATALGERGYSIAISVLQRHRRGDCRCSG